MHTYIKTLLLCGLASALHGEDFLTYEGHFAVDSSKKTQFPNFHSREAHLLDYGDGQRLFVNGDFGNNASTRVLKIPTSFSPDGSSKVSYETEYTPSPSIEWSKSVQAPTGGTLYQKYPTNTRVGGSVSLGNHIHQFNFWIFYHNDGKPYPHLQKYRFDPSLNRWSAIDSPKGPNPNFRHPFLNSETTYAEGTLTSTKGTSLYTQTPYLAMSAWMTNTGTIITGINDVGNTYQPTPYLTGQVRTENSIAIKPDGGFIYKRPSPSSSVTNEYFVWKESHGVQGWYGGGDMENNLNPKKMPGLLNYPDVWGFSGKGYHASGENGYQMKLKWISLTDLKNFNSTGGDLKKLIRQIDVTPLTINKKVGTSQMGISYGKTHYKSVWGGMVRVGNKVYIPEYVHHTQEFDVKNQDTLHIHVFRLN